MNVQRRYPVRDGGLSDETMAMAHRLVDNGSLSPTSLPLMLMSESPDAVVHAALRLAEHLSIEYESCWAEFGSGNALGCENTVLATVHSSERLGLLLELESSGWIDAAAGVFGFMTSCGEEHLDEVESTEEFPGFVHIKSDTIAGLVMAHPERAYEVGEFMVTRKLSNSDALFVVEYFTQPGARAVTEGWL